MSLTGIALLPPKSLIDKLNAFRREHGEAITPLPNEPGILPPHLTLLVCPFRDDLDYIGFSERMADSAPIGNFKLEQVGWRPQGPISIMVSPTAWLRQAQKMAICLVGHLVDKDAIEPNPELHGIEAYHHERYGYSKIGDLLNPEFVLGTAACETRKVPAKLTDDFKGHGLAGLTATPAEVVVYRCGPDGSAKKILARHEIGSRY